MLRPFQVMVEEALLDAMARNGFWHLMEGRALFKVLRPTHYVLQQSISTLVRFRVGRLDAQVLKQFGDYFA